MINKKSKLVNLLCFVLMLGLPIRFDATAVLPSSLFSQEKSWIDWSLALNDVLLAVLSSFGLLGALQTLWLKPC